MHPGSACSRSHELDCVQCRASDQEKEDDIKSVYSFLTFALESRESCSCEFPVLSIKSDSSVQ